MRSNPDLQLEQLKKKFGLNLYWVEIKMPLTYSEVEKYFGSPCEEYDHLCAVCNAWAEFHRNNQVVTMIFERDEILKTLDHPIKNLLTNE